MTNNNRDKWNKTIQTRMAKDKATVLEQLRKMPILQVSLDRSGIVRSTYYKWRKDDAVFSADADMAIAEGEALITDMSEAQLISLIHDKHFPSLQFWLKHHSSKYADKVELTGNFNIKEEPLTPEQEALVNKALELAGLLENKQNQ